MIDSFANQLVFEWNSFVEFLPRLLFAGFFLAFSRPFKRGDLIETEGLTGRVQDILLRHTHIRTAEGCDIFVPSSQIFTKPLHNFTLDGLRRSSFTIGIDYGDDIRKAIKLLTDAVTAVQGVLKNPVSNVRIKGFESNFVELQISFWINTNDQETGLAKIQTETMDACRLALAKEKFTFSSNVSTNIDLSPVELKKEK